MVYNVTSRESFEQIEEHIKIIKKNSKTGVVLFIWGNKIDKDTEREVSSEEGFLEANKYNSNFIEVSAKEGTNVDELFSLIAAQIKDKVNDES